ncbi:hypothetical protein Tco_0534858 [Tanacetum coccineum]
MKEVVKWKAVVTEEQVAHSLVNLSKKKRTTDQFVFARRDQTPPDSTTGPSSQPEDDTSEKVVHESSSTSDSERTESDTESGTPKGDKVQGEIVSTTITSGVSIPLSNPEKAQRHRLDHDPEPKCKRTDWIDSGKLHVSWLDQTLSTWMMTSFATSYPKDHENLKLITEDDHEKSKAREESDSIYLIVDPSDSNVYSPVIAPSQLSHLQPIITTKSSKIGAEMSEERELDDALLKVLNDTLPFNSKKYSVFPGPESVKNQESKKSPKEIIKAKKEQDEEKQDSITPSSSN